MNLSLLARVARAPRSLWDARHFDHAPDEERRRLVRAELTRLLEVAVERTAFYAADRASAIRQTLSSSSDKSFFEAFARIAPLTKDDLSSRFDALCTDKEITLARIAEHDAANPNGDALVTTATGTYNVKKTSGTSGKVVYVVDTIGVQKEVGSLLVYRTLLRTLWAKKAYRALVPWPSRASLVVFVHRGNRSVYQGATSQGAPAWVRALLDVTIVGHDASLATLLADVERAAPAFLFGLPSRLEWLARATLSGSIRIAPTIVFAGGETLHDAIVATYRAAWPDACIVNTYGTTETKPIALACPECGELHVCEDFVHMELLDAEGHPCADGAEADQVFATGLKNFTMPVVRYALSDRIVPLPDAGCRWRTKRIRVRGREPAFLWVKSAKDGAWKALNGRMLKERLCALEGARGFVVRHDEADKLEVTLVVDDVTSASRVVDAAREAIDAFVAEHGATVGDVLGRTEVNAVDADKWMREGGKLQSIVSRVEPHDEPEEVAS